MWRPRRVTLVVVLSGTAFSYIAPQASHFELTIGSGENFCLWQQKLNRLSELLSTQYLL